MKFNLFKNITFKYNSYVNIVTVFIDEIDITSNFDKQLFDSTNMNSVAETFLPMCIFKTGNNHVNFIGLADDYESFRIICSEISCMINRDITSSFKPIIDEEYLYNNVMDIIENIKFPIKPFAFAKEINELKKQKAKFYKDDFYVDIIATMSSGKSTILNAILHDDLLPAANEATTATIAQIYHVENDEDHFYGRRFCHQDKLIEEKSHVITDTITLWNQDPNTKRIELRGKIPSFKKYKNINLILSDTPGPNNSNDTSHQNTTMDYIYRNQSNRMILYVLNATQIGINDDRNFIRELVDLISKNSNLSFDNVLFVVNKMDMFDPERENVTDVLGKVQIYLENNGIKNPRVIPVSSYYAKLLRKNQDDFSRRERNEFLRMDELFENESVMKLTQYYALNCREQKILESKNLGDKHIESGIPAIESFIESYITHSHIPAKIKKMLNFIRYASKYSLIPPVIVKNLEELINNA